MSVKDFIERNYNTLSKIIRGDFTYTPSEYIEDHYILSRGYILYPSDRGMFELRSGDFEEWYLLNKEGIVLKKEVL